MSIIGAFIKHFRVSLTQVLNETQCFLWWVWSGYLLLEMDRRKLMSKECHISLFCSICWLCWLYFYFKRHHNVLVEGKFPGESYSEGEYGDIGTRKTLCSN